jgi:cobalt-zinc-cadmium efflux system membrane fusion protein
MKSFYWQSVAAALMVSVTLTGCGKNDATTQAANLPAASAKTTAPAGSGLSLSQNEMQTAGIVTVPLNEQAVRNQITVTATIQANQDRLAHVSPRITGKIVKVLARLGEHVKPGQPLALVDSIEAGEAQSAYAQAAADQALAKAAAERADKLYADQIIAQKEYLRARADLQKADAALHAAAERRHALGLNGDAAMSANRASVFTVSAPFAGTVIDKKAVLGELAKPDNALFTIADLSTVWLDTNLFEKDLGKVDAGASATVTVAAYPGETFQGKLTYISSVMDKETRTAKARIEVPNPHGRLKIDMFANAAIAAGSAANALLLPDEAVVLVQGQPTVFVKAGEGFEPRAVELGDKLQNQVMLKAGIRAGETIVTRGAYALKARLLKSQISAED